MHNRLHKALCKDRALKWTGFLPGWEERDEKTSGFRLAVALSAGLSGGALAQDIGVVVKIGGIRGSTPWIRASRNAPRELGVTAEMIGPVSADPALQVQAIGDLIAKGRRRDRRGPQRRGRA